MYDRSTCYYICPYDSISVTNSSVGVTTTSLSRPCIGLVHIRPTNTTKVKAGMGSESTLPSSSLCSIAETHFPFNYVCPAAIWWTFEAFYFVRHTQRALHPAPPPPPQGEWLVDVTLPSNIPFDRQMKKLTILARRAHRKRHALVVRGLSDNHTSFGWSEVQSTCPNKVLTNEDYSRSDGERASIWRWAGMRKLSEGEPARLGCATTFAAFCDQVRSATALPVTLWAYSMPARCPSMAQRVSSFAFASVFRPEVLVPHRNGSKPPAYQLGRAFPQLYLHPVSTMSTAHQDAKKSYFWLRLFRGRKVVRLWPLDSLPMDGTAEGRFEAHPTRCAEFTINPGDLLYAPPEMWHAVKTVEPSLMVSSNYFPAVHASAERRHIRLPV